MIEYMVYEVVMLFSFFGKLDFQKHVYLGAEYAVTDIEHTIAYLRYVFLS